MIQKSEIKTLLEERLSYFLEPELIDELFEAGQIKDYPEDTVILYPNDEVKFIPIVLEGALKVSRERETGEELLLYYLENGDTCAMTVQCCVRKRNSEIKATTISNSKLLMFPVQKMEDWLDKYKSWREFVLMSYHARMMELVETVDALAFKNLDERLWKYLSDQAKLVGSLEINHTHQEIADDLHSSRVVISRLLKQLELKGDIQMNRNKIILSRF